MQRGQCITLMRPALCSRFGLKRFLRNLHQQRMGLAASRLWGDAPIIAASASLLSPGGLGDQALHPIQH
jgi:hypothetical protein